MPTRKVDDAARSTLSDEIMDLIFRVGRLTGKIEEQGHQICKLVEAYDEFIKQEKRTDNE
jgi:hypothetical protein